MEAAGEVSAALLPAAASLAAVASDVDPTPCPCWLPLPVPLALRLALLLLAAVVPVVPATSDASFTLEDATLQPLPKRSPRASSADQLLAALDWPLWGEAELPASLPPEPGGECTRSSSKVAASSGSAAVLTDRMEARQGTSL